MTLLANANESVGVKLTPAIPEGALLLSRGLSQPVINPTLPVSVLWNG